MTPHVEASVSAHAAFEIIVEYLGGRTAVAYAHTLDAARRFRDSEFPKPRVVAVTIRSAR